MGYAIARGRQKLNGLQLHRIAEVLAKYSCAVLQQQRIESLLDDRVGGGEARAPGFGHRTLFFGQRVQQIGEGGPVDVSALNASPTK